MLIRIPLEIDDVCLVLLQPWRLTAHRSCSNDDPSQQSSALDAVYRFLRSSSTPPTATSASTTSATNPMMLRSTQLQQRGCTLVASLITIHSRRSIRAILVQQKNIDPLVVTITLNFCMLSLHNLTIFFSMHVRYCTQSCWISREKEKSFVRQYNVMQTSLHGGFNGKPSPPLSRL